MLSGSIASDKKPHRSGNESDDGTYPKQGSPAVMDHQVCDDQWRKAGPRSSSGEDPAIRDAALRGRNPARDELIGGRIDDGLPGAKKKTNRDEDEQRAGDVGGAHGGHRGENSPPRDACRHHETRA